MSRLLLDTHVLLWWLADDPGLSAPARDALADPADEALVSAVSVWEIAIKRSLGKLKAPEDLPDRIVGEGFTWLPITADHAWRVREMPAHHRDPFDRLLIAQALAERLPIVTGDAAFEPYGVPLLW